MQFYPMIHQLVILHFKMIIQKWKQTLKILFQSTTYNHKKYTLLIVFVTRIYSDVMKKYNVQHA